ncbi:MAG: hypothetical protein E6K53_01220 [Gammaproteobacteria bacterium]|nr:MAG: hypothetical protein E6K53_01220 [Gammaproteobacteria bacterium]
MGTWECDKCGETVGTELSVCWNCGAHEDGSAPDVGFVRADEPIFSSEPKPRQLNCVRCGKPMELVGRKRFYEGPPAAPIRLGELFVNREVFDIHACTGCGKAELFVAEV